MSLLLLCRDCFQLQLLCISLVNCCRLMDWPDYGVFGGFTGQIKNKVDGAKGAMKAVLILMNST